MFRIPKTMEKNWAMKRKSMEMDRMKNSDIFLNQVAVACIQRHFNDSIRSLIQAPGRRMLVSTDIPDDMFKCF